MSRLTDLLDKTQTSSPGIGFAASRQAAATPDIAVIGRVSATELADDSALADSPADALIVTLDASDGSAASRVGDALSDRLWGARVGSASADHATALKDAGCDFIVFDPEGTAAAVLNDDALGKVIAVGFDEPEFDEDEARAIRTLDIDCALLTPTDGLLPLTVQKLLIIQKMRGIVRKRAIVNVPAETGKSELETLRNAGVAAIAVSLAEVGEDIQRIRDDIANLPRRKSQSTRGANTPRVGFGGGSASTEDFDEDDE
ncbi:MAG: hypothetical protein OXG80_08125 [Chloroflexi bacterium]|nr:hypothetical protein [Chloroflexota bacterium]